MGNIKPCPFCGHKDVLYFNGWFGGSEQAQRQHKSEGRFIDGDGRSPSICCNGETGGCDIGFSVAYFGEGLSDEEAKEITINAWNRRIN